MHCAAISSKLQSPALRQPRVPKRLTRHVVAGVHHVVRERPEAAHDLLDVRASDAAGLQRLTEVPQPAAREALVDDEREVTPPQPRMPEPLRIQRLAAQPLLEEPLL